MSPEIKWQNFRAEYKNAGRLIGKQTFNPKKPNVKEIEDGLRKACRAARLRSFRQAQADVYHGEKLIDTLTISK